MTQTPLEKHLFRTIYHGVMEGRSPYGATDPRLFFDEVGLFFSALMSCGGAPAAGTFAFVGSEQPHLEADFDEWKLIGSLRKDAPKLPDGPLILCTSNLKLALCRHDGQMTVPQLEAKIREYSLSDRPIAFVIPSEAVIIAHPFGLDGGEERNALAQIPELQDIDPNDIGACIEKFHELHTLYPSGVGAVWINAGKRLVERNAERSIRDNLYKFFRWQILRSRFVTREVQLTNGRIDIYISANSSDDAADDKLIELKVLRTRASTWTEGKKQHSDESVKKYVIRGIHQARRYKDETKVGSAYLCCFDARVSNNGLEVDRAANEQTIIYRRYFMESSAKEAADEGASSKASST